MTWWQWVIVGLITVAMIAFNVVIARFTDD